MCLKFSFNSLGTGKKIWHFSMRHIQIWRHAFFCQKVLKYFKDFVLKIKCNLCLFALSWFEIKHKTRHYQGQNSFIFTYKMCNEKIIKRKIVNLQMRKNKLAGWKVLKQFFNTYLECLKFLSACIISLYTKLELIAMNKIGKVWLHSTFQGISNT